MSLLSVYPPLIIKAESPTRDRVISYPPTVDPKTGYPVNGFYARVIFQMMEGHGTHVEASSHAFGESGMNIDDYPLSRYIDLFVRKLLISVNQSNLLCIDP